MSSPRPPTYVRNVSHPVHHNTTSNHPRPVTRVSSFSTLVKPSFPARRELTDSDDDDGMVPDLPFRSCQNLHLLSEQYQQCPSVPPADHINQTTLSVPLQTVRDLIRASLSTLFLFLPPTYSSSDTDTQLKFLFISAISILLLAPATTLCYLLPDANNLHILAVLIAAVPIIARTTASVFLTTTLLVAIIMTFTFTASALISPVLLVWSSVVPVITFATLGNRLGLASSAITAASVAAVDFSEQGHAGNSRLIIASWLLFLGVLSVVQKQIPAVVRSSSCLPPPDSSTVRRKQGYLYHQDHHHYLDDEHHQQAADDSDLEVPDAVLLHGRNF